MNVAEPEITTVSFRPGLVSRPQTWSVNAHEIRKGGEPVVRLGEIESYRYTDMPYKRLQIAEFTLFTTTGKHTVTCTHGRHAPERQEFFTLVTAVLRRLEASKPHVRGKGVARAAAWAMFLVGAALATAAVWFFVLALGSSEPFLFVVFGGITGLLSLIFLLGTPPWKEPKPVTPRQTIEFILAGLR